MPLLGTTGGGSSRGFGRFVGGISDAFDAIVKILVGLSNGKVFSSSNSGSAWTTVVDIAGGVINDVAVSPEASGYKYLVGADNGIMLASKGGEAWTTLGIGFGASAVRAVGYDGTNFVASSTPDLTKVSTNGISWTTIAIDHGLETTVSQSLTSANTVGFAQNTLYRGIIGSTGAILSSTKASQSSSQYTSIYNGPGYVWSTVTLNPSALNTTGLSYTLTHQDGTFIIAGPSRSVLTSTDGITWTTRSGLTNGIGPTSKFIRGNGIWLVGGSNGNISNVANLDTNWNNGINTFWTTVYVSALVYGNGRYIASSLTQGNIKESTNGTTWSEANAMGTQGNGANAGVYGNGIFVLVGPGGRIKTQAAGGSYFWTTRTSGLEGSVRNITDVAYGNGAFAAVGQGVVVKSTDGITWTSSLTDPSPQHQKIAYANGIWTVGGDFGSIRTSTDLVTWTTATSNLPTGATGNIRALVSNASNRFLSWGQYGLARVSTPSKKFTSPTSVSAVSNTRFVVLDQNAIWETSDLVNYNSLSLAWTSVSTTLLTSVNTIAYGNGVFAGGAGGTTAIRSTNGTTWTTSSHFMVNGMGQTKYGNGIFMGIGAGGYNTAQWRRSTDGITWATISPGFSIANSQRFNTAIGNDGGNVWLTGGYYGHIYRSGNNAISWATQTSNMTVTVRDFAFGNSTWIAVGNSGNVRRSTNGGYSWATVTSPTVYALNTVRFKDGIFVAGADGTAASYSPIYRSTNNGATWTSVSTSFTSFKLSKGLAENNEFLGTGSIAGVATLARSTDGLTWTTYQTPALIGVNGWTYLEYGNGLYVGNRSGQTSVNTSTPISLGLSNVYTAHGNLIGGNGGRYVSYDSGSNTYTVKTTGINDDVKKIGLYGTTTVFVGNNASYFSTNQVTWTTMTTPFVANTVNNAEIG
jgi:hypothetical protein